MPICSLFSVLINKAKKNKHTVHEGPESVVELMRESLYDVLRDETGVIDIGRSTGLLQ